MKISELFETGNMYIPISSKSKSFDSKYQFTGYLSGQHGVTKKVKGKDGKVYYIAHNKTVAVWDDLLGNGRVYEKSKKD